MQRNTIWTMVLAFVLATGAGFYIHGSGVALAEEHVHNPRIHKAIEALHDAETELNEAHHDFHGKKKDAIEAIHKAIERLDEIKDYED